MSTPHPMIAPIHLKPSHHAPSCGGMVLRSFRWSISNPGTVEAYAH
jgi:hypothetical protein